MNQNKLVWPGFSVAAFTITWSVASSIMYSPSVQGQPPSLILNSDSVKVKLLSQKNSQKNTTLDNLDFSGTGRPNTRTPGAIRTICPTVDLSLIHI